jgi:hypothetical protein
MSLLNVYLEGARDPSPAGVRRLAMLIAARYGLSAPELEKRLSSGRFRVKANVDEPTARAFVADLEALGARCSTASAELATRPMPAETVGAGAGGAGASAVAAARPATSRTMTLPMAGLATRPATAPGRATASAPGLAAQLADATYSAGGLGALDGATFSLATLDGQADGARPASSSAFAGAPSQPPAALAGAGPLSPEPYSAPAELHLEPLPSAHPRERAPAIDRFAPPAEESPTVALLDEVRPRHGSLAPEGARMVTAAIATIPRPVAARADVGAQRRRRQLLVGGVLVAIALSFIPVHVIAKHRERSAFARVDSRLIAAQTAVVTLEEWKSLDDIRTARLREKNAAHQQIALLSFLLWVGCTAGLSFAWLRLGVPRLVPAPRER